MADLGKTIMKTLTAATALALVLILGDEADTPNLDGECVIAGDCHWDCNSQDENCPQPGIGGPA